MNEDDSAIHRARWLILVPFCLLFFIFSSLVDLVIDIQVHQVERLERNLSRYKDQSIGLGSMELAKAKLDSALSWSFNNPDYLQMAGRHGVWLSTLNCSDSLKLEDKENKISSHNETLDCVYLNNIILDQSKFFIEGQTVRPYWPYSYSEHVLLLATLLARDFNVLSEFESAWLNAMKYGKNEPEVIGSLLNAGFGSWDYLSWGMKSKTIMLFEKGITGSYLIAKKTYLIAKNHNRMESLCILFSSKDYLPEFFINDCTRT